ncbi:hypothetical protein LZC95_22190 [Pendulispora brunnea]|uniref:Uncharacterized protein n=1 Tax=Pendulispora brunnea TaxID=2905690 RepID=A0ABZ2KT80_9BACT
MKQQTLTLVAKVRDGAKLRALLGEIARTRVLVGIKEQPAFFADPKLGIHFARLVHIPSEGRFDAWLALESNFDSDSPDPDRARELHIDDLVRSQPDVMRALFSCCEGFPKDASLGAIGAYCKRHLVAATVTYEGHASRSLDRIRLEQHVREVVLDFVGTRQPKPPLELFGEIRDHVRAQTRKDPRLKELDLDVAPPASPDPRVRSDKLGAGLFPWVEQGIPTAAKMLPSIPSIVKWNSEDDGYDPSDEQQAWTSVDRESFNDLAATEDYGLQNALTHVVPLKAGVDREAVLRQAHAYIDRMSHEHFADIGCLGGIPTIHFAKWLLIDGGKRLLFFSNYDHSWESYLGDFIDAAALGLNLAWSCTEKYPKTTWLFTGGAKDEEAFKAWGRKYQRPTQVFYSAYPDLSISTINNNTWIRYGLHYEPGTIDLETWFRRLT